jgi:hypothetical protein
VFGEKKEKISVDSEEYFRAKNVMNVFINSLHGAAEISNTQAASAILGYDPNNVTHSFHMVFPKSATHFVMDQYADNEHRADDGEEPPDDQQSQRSDDDRQMDIGGGGGASDKSDEGQGEGDGKQLDADTHDEGDTSGSDAAHPMDIGDGGGASDKSDDGQGEGDGQKLDADTHDEGDTSKAKAKTDLDYEENLKLANENTEYEYDQGVDEESDNHYGEINYDKNGEFSGVSSQAIDYRFRGVHLKVMSLMDYAVSVKITPIDDKKPRQQYVPRSDGGDDGGDSDTSVDGKDGSNDDVEECKVDDTGVDVAKHVDVADNTGADGDGHEDDADKTGTDGDRQEDEADNSGADGDGHEDEADNPGQYFFMIFSSYIVFASNIPST